MNSTFLMSSRDYRILFDPFYDEVYLREIFENLNLSDNDQPTEMEQQIQQLSAQLTQLATASATQIAELLAANAQMTQKLNQLEATQATNVQQPNVTVTEYADIETTYISGNDIQLDAFKIIHEFNGDKKVYRSWRTQVAKLMKQIEQHQTHPKYAAALSIVRAKITGPASDILINNNTAHNIDAIIDRLDFSYSDQRPLYVIEAEMTAIKQGSKTLQEFYDAINQALNMVLTKITMTYKVKAEQKSLIVESQSKAIRTFITGLNSTLIRTTLYGNMPDSLSKAFAIAQTIQYDNQHLQLECKTTDQYKNVKKFNETRPISNPNFRYNTQQVNPTPKPNVNNPPQNKTPQTPIPMEIDNSGQFVQKTRFQPNGFQQMKRTFEPSFQNASRPPTYQHVNKSQRVNHVEANEDIRSIHGGSMENNCDDENQDNQSIVSQEESIFLDE